MAEILNGSPSNTGMWKKNITTEREKGSERLRDKGVVDHRWGRNGRRTVLE